MIGVGERCPLISSEALLSGLEFGLCLGPHLQGTLAFPENASQKQPDLTLLSTHPEPCLGHGTPCSGTPQKVDGLGVLVPLSGLTRGQPWALLSPQGTSQSSPLPSLRVPHRFPEDDSKQDHQVGSVGKGVQLGLITRV